MKFAVLAQIWNEMERAESVGNWQEPKVTFIHEFVNKQTGMRRRPRNPKRERQNVDWGKGTEKMWWNERK